MKKLFTLLMLFYALLPNQQAQAQERTVSGQVKSAQDGAPLPGVSVTVKGFDIGQQTDLEGRFSIALPSGSDVLVFNFLGFVEQEVNVAEKNNVTVSLKTDVSQLNEVVVTALGISRERRSLGYAAQSVNADDLAASRQPNLVNALQGKVAGVTISSTGGAPGQGASILIRGINSIDLGRSSSPLFVIDGVLLDNSTFTTGAGASLRGMTNRAADINPDNIASISILKGGAATALYGLRGANGVVVITTKSGEAGKLTVNLSSTIGTEEVNKFPEVQRTYTQGYGGVYESDSFWPSWGPTVEEARKLDPTHPAQLYDNYRNGYIQGYKIRNTLSLSGGNEKAKFYTALSQLHHKGVLPFTNYDKWSIKANGDIQLSDKLKMGSSLYFVNSGGFRYNADRFNESLTYWSPRWDVQDFLKEDGTMKTYGNNNPVYGAYTNRFKDNVNRLIGNINFNYQPTDWFSINYRFGLDTYNDSRTRYAPGPKGVPDEIVYEDNGQGFINEYRLNFRALNSTLIFGFDHDFSEDFNATLRLGGDLYDRKIGRVSTEGEELAVFDWFDLRNAKVVTASQYNEDYRLLGFFGELTLDYKNYLYLTLTGRNDITSTLLKPNNSFFYPSASLSYIFSDHLSLPDVISYGKLRFSAAGIGKDAPVYATTQGYSSAGDFPIGTTIGFTRNGTRGDPDLIPERTETYEIGTNMQFFDSRLGFDLTLYKSLSKNQIISVPVSNTTGYTSIFVNSGEIRNRGLEVILNATPVKTENFNWDLTLNFSANRNKVLSIREGLSEIFISSQYGYAGSSVSTKLIPGQSIGNLYGTYHQRYYAEGETEDPLHIDYERPIVIDEDGFPLEAEDSGTKILGNYMPDWIGGMTNTLSYKNFGLSFLIDIRQGVEKYNQFSNFMAAFGTAAYTENRNEMIVFDGVLADGSRNTKEVFLGQETGPDGVDYGNGYYRNYYRGVSENFIEDASWIRLRTLTLSYDLPKTLLEKTPLSAVGLTLTGNNLWLSTDYSTFDPETSFAPSGSNNYAFSGFTYPAVRSFLLTLNVSF